MYRMTIPLEQLRSRYPQFRYEACSYTRCGQRLQLRFQFVVEPDIVFRPKLSLESVDPQRFDSLEPPVLNNLVFHLGLIEMLSYWKATCSPHIFVQAGYLDARQIDWWKDLLLHGMREFFYRNRINYKQKDFVRLSSDHTPPSRKPVYSPVLQDERDLVLLSGGKDSALSVQLLREGRRPFNAILLNPAPAARTLAARAACSAPIIVSRDIDPKLLQLNAAGYLNGHTPFSAYLAMLGLLAAVVGNYRRIVAANERGSEEASAQFLGSGVNHQYSKTLRFERAFQWYSRRYLASQAYYFSLLRPLYELQITRLFARYPEYFRVFKSCNRNLKEDTWCGTCAKCVFVFIALHPFLGAEELRSIFGRDLFADERLIGIIRQLLGFYEHRPFECVGTSREVLAALYLSISKTKPTSLPAVLRYVAAEIMPRSPDVAQTTNALLGGWGERHGLPGAYVELLRHRLDQEFGHAVGPDAQEA